MAPSHWQWRPTGTARVCWRVNDFRPKGINAWSNTCWHLETKLPEYEVQVFFVQKPIPGGSENAVRVSLSMNCWIDVIKPHFSANHKKVICAMDVSCISVYALFDQYKFTFNPAHPSLLSLRCWPWGVFISWMASRDPGTTHSSDLVGV